MAIRSGSGSASSMLANVTRSGLRDRAGNGLLLPRGCYDGTAGDTGTAASAPLTIGKTGFATWGAGQTMRRGARHSACTADVNGGAEHGNPAAYPRASEGTTPGSREIGNPRRAPR